MLVARDGLGSGRAQKSPQSEGPKADHESGGSGSGGQSPAKPPRKNDWAVSTNRAS